MPIQIRLGRRRVIKIIGLILLIDFEEIIN